MLCTLIVLFFRLQSGPNFYNANTIRIRTEHQNVWNEIYIFIVIIINKRDCVVFDFYDYCRYFSKSFFLLRCSLLVMMMSLLVLLLLALLCCVRYYANWIMVRQHFIRRLSTSHSYNFNGMRIVQHAENMFSSEWWQFESTKKKKKKNMYTKSIRENEEKMKWRKRKWYEWKITGL